MKPSIAASLLVALALPAPAMARNPAASLSVAAPAQAATDAAPTRMQPVPGYKFIAAGLLLGVAAIIFAFTQQDGTPASN